MCAAFFALPGAEPFRLIPQKIRDRIHCTVHQPAGLPQYRRCWLPYTHEAHGCLFLCKCLLQEIARQIRMCWFAMRIVQPEQRIQNEYIQEEERAQHWQTRPLRPSAHTARRSLRRRLSLLQAAALSRTVRQSRKTQTEAEAQGIKKKKTVKTKPPARMCLYIWRATVQTHNMR